MKLSDYHFDLPPALIAQHALEERTASRLLCLDGKTGDIVDRVFSDLPDLLMPNDLVVFNESRVIPARMFGKKATGGAVELLVERVVSEKVALCHVRASKSPKPRTKIFLEGGISALVMGRQEALFELEFTGDGSVFDMLDKHGHIPLPPYIERADQESDRARYQTVYAREPGSVAAPTAGLHFDAAILEKIKAKGIKTAFVTLHVGAGTFKPVQCDNLEDHVMHAERVDVSRHVCDLITQTRAAGGRIIAVGTTVVRSLESAAKSGQIKPYSGDTQLFITPGWDFKVIDVMVTNFHLPGSTLLMLVSAFAGYQTTRNAYTHAIEKAYRFFSYGDAMFITPSPQD